MFGQMFLVTQYLQTVLGFTALQAGVRMLPMRRRDAGASPRCAPRLVERVGTKLVVGTGLLLAAGGLVVRDACPWPTATRTCSPPCASVGAAWAW